MVPNVVRWISLSLLVGLVALLPSPAAGEDDRRSTAPPKWDPAHTWVFAVSSIEWKFDHKLDMPKKGRHDQDLMDTLKACGVPAGQIVLLKDKQGTLAEIKRQFTALLERTQKDDLLFFYFQGHGARDVNGSSSRYYFTNYDCNPANYEHTTWFLTDIYDQIEKSFKGSRALMTADCCTSGGLVVEARKRKSPIQYACLTSVFAHNNSTGRWTYTEGLIKGLKGDPAVDLNGDGVIRLDELARYIDQEMAFIEVQKADYAALHGFPGNLELARTSAKRTPELGKHVEAVWNDGKWWKAEVLGIKDGRTQVQYVDDYTVQWKEPAQVRPWVPPSYPAGTKVSVLWQQKWYPATVKQAYLGLHFIHYDQDGPEWDEWVGPDRIKKV